MKTIGIIGGGLAGTAMAYFASRQGYDCTIYDAAESLAQGASGNALGLYNPRFFAEYSPQAQFYHEAFLTALSLFPTLGDINFDPCGALHLINSPEKARRFEKLLKNWADEEDDFQRVSTRDASEIAGIELDYDALWLPRSGTVSPKKLCKAYAAGIPFVQADITPDTLPDHDVIVLACGVAAKRFVPELEIQTVRGQITEIHETLPLKCNICYGGYMTKSLNGRHIVGSTFQKWLDHRAILDEDNAQNIEKARNFISLPGNPEILGARASLRTVAKDHNPIIGHLRDHLYISTAHGSHGILSSLMGAKMILNLL